MASLKVSIALQNTIASFASGEELIGIVGSSTQGPTGDYTVVGNTTDLAAIFGSGPLVTAAEIALRAGRRVALWRDGGATLSYGAAATVVGNAGTAVAGDITYDAVTKPTDRSFTTIKITNGGTTGTAGITYQYARRYNGPAGLVTGDYNGVDIALGTALTITLPDGVKVNIATGKTFTTGALISNIEGNLPTLQSTQITSAIARIGSYARPIRALFVVDDTTNAKLSAIATARAALLPLGKLPLIVAQVAQATNTTTPSAFLTSVTTAKGSVQDTHVAIVATEGEITTLLGGRVAMWPAIAAFIDAVSRVSPSTDLRTVAKPGVLATTAITPSASSDVVGPVVSSISPQSPATPIGGWDDAAAGDVLSALSCGALRKVPGFAGTYISDHPVLQAANTALNNIARARVVTLAVELAYTAFFTWLAQNLPTDNQSRILPFACDLIDQDISEQVTKAMNGAAQSVTFATNRSDAINDEQASGTLTIKLYNVIVQFTITAPITR